MRNSLDFYSETYNDLIDQMEEVLSADFDHMQITTRRSEMEFTDPPDYIPDQCKEHLFIQSEYVFNQMKSIGEQVLFLEIDGVKIGTYVRYKGVFFAFESDMEGTDTDITTIDERLDQARINEDWIDSDKIRAFLSVAKDMYGEENVWVGIPKQDPNFCHVKIGRSSRVYVIIKHDPFWCCDDFDLRVKLHGGLSSHRFTTDGDINQDLKFTTTIKDRVFAYIGMVHPHVPTVQDHGRVHFRNVCRGSGSPINTAIGAWVDSPCNEDMIYNYLLNFNNLLESESEQGVPHYRMRREILKISRTDGVSNMSYSQLIDAIIEEGIDLSVDVESSGLSIEIDTDSIVDYLSSESGAGERYYKLASENRLYKKEVINNGNSLTYRHGSMYFNGQEMPIEVVPHKPENFDLSGMSKDSDIWEVLESNYPKEKTLDKAERKISSIANYNLIEEGNVNKISHEEISEELLGLSEIQRDSNIDSIIEPATTN